jgi:hypothetical protein
MDLVHRLTRYGHSFEAAQRGYGFSAANISGISAQLVPQVERLEWLHKGIYLGFKAMRKMDNPPLNHLWTDLNLPSLVYQDTIPPRKVLRCIAPSSALSICSFHAHVLIDGFIHGCPRAGTHTWLRMMLHHSAWRLRCTGVLPSVVAPWSCMQLPSMCWLNESSRGLHNLEAWFLVRCQWRAAPASGQRASYFLLLLAGGGTYQPVQPGEQLCICNAGLELHGHHLLRPRQQLHLRGQHHGVRRFRQRDHPGQPPVALCARERPRRPEFGIRAFPAPVGTALAAAMVVLWLIQCSQVVVWHPRGG